jgi:alpha-tubulin suppressor-like RCC1 family protein
MNSSSNARASLAILRITPTVMLGAAIWCSTAQAQTVNSRVATGAGHGIVLKSHGSVWTWGGNFYGQRASAAGRAALPVRVPGLTGIRDVTAGDGFWLAVQNDGLVWAWGGNEYGELGREGLPNSREPLQITGLNGIAAVAAAGQRALALKSDGTVWSWGDDPLHKHSASPRPVAGLSGVTAIAAALKHSVALRSDGSVWVWGYHGAGDLGNGEYGISGSPVQIRGLAGIKAIAAGQDLTVAVKQDGTVWTIGYGAAGQLGNGGTQNSTAPVCVTGLSGVEAVAAGAMHVLALRRDGTVWAWGYNHDGQLGNLTAGEQSFKPVRVGSLSGVVSVAAASNHSVALAADGTLWAWGQNEGGGLGVGENELDRSAVPMRVGESVPPRCTPLFSCQTASNKMIQICGVQDEADVAKWTAIQYRFGPEDGPPELAFPKEPWSGRPLLFFSHEESRGDYRISVRFSNGGYSYRVFSSSKSGAGVEVANANGKRITIIECAERPLIFVEYLRLSLPCDKQNPHGAAACQEPPYREK